jgi:hypothetical protein
MSGLAYSACAEMDLTIRIHDVRCAPVSSEVRSAILMTQEWSRHAFTRAKEKMKSASAVRYSLRI